MEEEKNLQICMKCKAIKISKEDEFPRWLKKDIAPRLYEMYTKRAKELSHGYCPECADEYIKENKL